LRMRIIGRGLVRFPAWYALPSVAESRGECLKGHRSAGRGSTLLTSIEGLRFDPDRGSPLLILDAPQQLNMG
jgi:hypothetical protein